MMGYLTAAGSLSRIIGPIYMGQMYGFFGPRLSFAIILAMLILSVFLCAWHYPRFVPFGMKELYAIHYSDMGDYLARKNAEEGGEGDVEDNRDGTYVSVEDTNM